LRASYYWKRGGDMTALLGLLRVLLYLYSHWARYQVSSYMQTSAVLYFSIKEAFSLLPFFSLLNLVSLYNTDFPNNPRDLLLVVLLRKSSFRLKHFIYNVVYQWVAYISKSRKKFTYKNVRATPDNFFNY
jgi:hypothetical protein